MSIKNKRLQRATEEILREELEKGNLPTSKEFAWKLSQKMEKSDFSKPEFVYQSVRDGMLMYAERHNASIGQISRDLGILYENVREIHELLGTHFSAFEVEREILEKEIFAVETRLREKVLLYAQSGFLTAVFDVFDSFEKMDESRSENVLLDTKNHEVRLVEELRLSKRVPVTTTRFDIIGSYEKKVADIGMPIEVIHDGFDDESWQQVIHTKEDREVTGEVTLSFGEGESINQVVISLMTIKPVGVQVLYTGDGLNWLEVPYHEQEVLVSGRMDLKFPSIGVKEMKIRMRKKEHDEQVPEEEGFEFRYLFGLKEIEVRNLRFPEQGVYQSKPMAIDGPANYVVNKVSLDVEEVLPTGTDIVYEVALSGSEDWRGISPIGRKNAAYPLLVDFQRIEGAEPVSFSMGGELSVSQSIIGSLETNGISFYSLGKVSGKRIIEGSERLYVGRNSWECKSYEEDKGEDHVPSLDDWAQPSGETLYEYEMMSALKRSTLFENKKGSGRRNYYCRCGVLYDGTEDVLVMTPSSTEPISVFLNGEKVFEGIPESSRVNLKMLQGWNELVVLVYGVNHNTVNGMTVDIGIDMIETFRNMYVSPTPMKKVPLFDLRYNTKILDRTKYAVSETETGYEIILNYGVDGLLFDFFFDYALASDIEGKEIVLRATFKREGAEDVPSPTLKKFRLRMA